MSPTGWIRRPGGRAGRIATLLAAVLGCLAAEARGGAARGEVGRPFVLWDRRDLARIHKKLQTEAWAKAAFQRWADDRYLRPLANLLRYAALGDQEAGQQEKAELMRVARSPVPRGAAQWITVLRFDLLHPLLAPGERREVETCFRAYVENHVFKRAVLHKAVFNDSRRYSRYDARKYTRSNWLPNIIWPWKVSANLMAAALADEPLIRRTWAAYGSWRWYFDAYLCDLGFYSEEFSKMGSTPGAMILYCLALDRLGLGDLGFGYRGKGGATMKGHIHSLLHLGYPRVDLGSPRPHYPMVTLGDLRHSGSSQHANLPGRAFQHALVMGYPADGRGGNPRWMRHGAWGGTRRGNSPQWDRDKTPKMQIPLWLELGHSRWPELGFGYFLAQLRAPDEERYIPSLLFGLDPIDPARVKPPPAPSAVWPERGLAMLRADESPAYWDSPAPAVCMRLATNYAHRVNDSFALVGFYAFHRPLYLNRQSLRAYAQGYSRSIQSHCGLIVDGREPAVTSAASVRKAFTPEVKFVAARSAKVYPDVDLTRALFLTRDYLLDVADLRSAKPRAYHWLVHALGQADTGWPRADRIEGLPHKLEGVRSLAAAGRPWSVTVIQDCPLPDPKAAAMGEAWYAKRIGVRVHMLGMAGTTAYVADTPYTEPIPRKPPPGPDEIGGVTVVAARRCPRTAFVALHEPFKAAAPRIRAFRRAAETNDALAVTIAGKPGTGIDDRLMLRLGDKHDELTTLAAGGESFRFSDFAYVRVARDAVVVRGGLKAMRLRVEGRPKLVVNGEERKAAVANGFLVFGSAAE